MNRPIYFNQWIKNLSLKLFRGKFYYHSFPLLPILILTLFGITACPSKKTPHILVIVHNNSDSTAQVTEAFMHRLSKKTSSDYPIAIEQARGESIVSLFSHQATRRAIREISFKLDGDSKTPHLDPISSDPETMVKAMHRLSDHAHKTKTKARPLRVFIITSGTSKNTVIQRMKAISQLLVKKGLKSHIQLYMIGLDEEHRLKMAQAVSPLVGSVFLSGNNDYEWTNYLDECF